MTPERQKMLYANFDWRYKPDCLCTFCAEYRDELVQLDAGVPVDETEVIDARILRRLSADMAPAAKVGANAAIEGNDFRADELGAKKPKTESDRRKATPIFSGVMRYFPDALAAVARLSKAGNDKHNPGEPLHWSREKSTDHGDCIARHQISFDQIDEETSEYHAVAVAWRALAQLQLLEEVRIAKAKAAESVKVDNSAAGWNKWLPSWKVRPRGRVDVELRNGCILRGADAESFNWGDVDAGTIVAYRRAA